MMNTIIDPQQIRHYYNAFLKGDRILMTGHSHQAWPNIARLALIEAFEDAANCVDDKWDLVFKKCQAVRNHIARCIDAKAEEIALAPNTHELFTRFLSALPLDKKPVIVATTGEFHSVYRQLVAIADRIQIQWVEAQPYHNLAQRLSDAITEQVSAVVCSAVMFQDATIVPHLSSVHEKAQALDCRLFVDAYHAFKIMPLSIKEYGNASHLYLSGGGYKYAQWGEGACWMRAPAEDHIQPKYTGWFSDFEHLDAPRTQSSPSIRYGTLAMNRFAGSTFDPSSWYRAAAVCAFFEENDLSIDRLRANSILQTSYLIDHLKANGFKILSPEQAEQRGGFVSIDIENADLWVEKLREKRIFVDARGRYLRLGPAPYLTQPEFDEVIYQLTKLKNTALSH